MISRETLSKVLKKEVKEIRWIKPYRNSLQYDCKTDDDYTELNLDTLHRLCEDFVYNNSMNEIASYSMQDSEQFRCIIGTDLKFGSKDKQGFYGNSKLEATIKATEFVINKIKP